MAKVIVREATGEQEIEVVRSLMRAYGQYLASNPSGAANICLENYERELANLPGGYGPPGGTLLLAWLDGEAAGCVALRSLRPSGTAGEVANRMAEKACELKRLWVDGKFRGHGVGKRLTEAALQWSARAGYDAIYLDTVPAAMPEANALYAALGFKSVERYNENRVADVVFFRRSLL